MEINNRYKNKLTNIMRICKKECYNKILENDKNNMKGVWIVHSSIIRNGAKKIQVTQSILVRKIRQ